MKKRLFPFILLGVSQPLLAQEIPSECQTFLAEAESMFKLIGLEKKSMENELAKYRRDMQNLDPIKLPRMCSDASEAIKEQLPELEKQVEQIKALKKETEKSAK